MATSSTGSTSCTVTNSVVPASLTNTTSAQTGWDGSIAIINAYNSSSSSTGQGYQQDTLALLPFADGSDSLASGNTSTITLDQAMVVNGQTITMTLYNLIVAQANNLFPVLSTSEMQSFSQPYSYPPLAATSTNSSSCANALLFYQNICAFPSSTLAQNFEAVCSDTTTSATSASGVDTSVNAFFASTKDYENVTFDSYIAVTSYLSTYANAWANFASSYTYYLYKSSGSTGSTGGGGATPEGTVTFTQGPPGGVPSPTDPSGGYTITYTDPNGSKTQLYFASGQIVSSTEQDIPLICLQCSYTQLSQFTGNSNDAGTLVPVILGNLNGFQVIGVFTKESTSTDSNWLTSIENFFSSGGIALFLQMTGLLMGLKLIYDGLSWVKGKLTSSEQANKGDAPSEEQVQEIQDDVPEVQDQMQAQQQDLADNLDEGVEVPAADGVAAAQDALAAAQEEEQVEEQVQAEENQIDAQAEELQTEAEVEVTPDMEAVAEDERTELSELEAIDPSNTQDAESELSDVEDSVTTDDTTLSTVEADEATELSNSQQEAIDEAEEAETEAADVEEEEEEAEEATSEGEDEEDFEDDVADGD